MTDWSLPLSELLKEGTAEAHDNIEHSPGAGYLTRAELDKEEYARYLMLLWYIYDSFERALTRHQSHPTLQPHTAASLKMPHSFGYRARTRHMFKRGFKEHGHIKISSFLIPYRVGDIVDIKANAAQQKGMPHKYYHGRTGIVYNVTPSAVGVIVYKIVGNRYIQKRVNLRVEHVIHSKCRQEFLDRVKSNHDAHAAAKEKGERINLRRIPAQPRESRKVSTADNVPQTLVPLPYDTTI
jgi:large subunit ribosomal protein L21e